MKPKLVVHADWGSDPGKRWMCTAEKRGDDSYEVHPPEPVGSLADFLSRLWDRSERSSVLVGFDFPIGLPQEYARSAGIGDFKSVLPKFGKGRWKDFYQLAEVSSEISIHRPFYPYRPGGTKQKHLLDGLGLESRDQLLRRCERRTETRGSACPLFWTLGGNQVGRAAILGWEKVLTPALERPDLEVALWPFDGGLTELLENYDMTIVETYPAEACLHLGMSPPGRGWSKTSQSDRKAQAARIQSWASERSVSLGDDLVGELRRGFGDDRNGEDPFDAVVGLLSMVEIVLGHRKPGAPSDPAVRTVEGWILGQEPSLTLL